MKQLTCEMCGGTDLLKQDGVFVCQSCGMKYSVEEAKKMMIEGTVDVQGTVKVDSSDELENLYQIARRAKSDDNSENAAKYYDMILIKDHTSWEAAFYTVYFKAKQSNILNMYSAIVSVDNCLKGVFESIKNNVKNVEEQVEAVKDIINSVSVFATLTLTTALNHYDGIDSSIKDKYFNETVSRCNASIALMYNCGDLIDKLFDFAELKKQAANAWELGITINRMRKYTAIKELTDHYIEKMVNVALNNSHVYTKSELEKIREYPEKVRNKYTGLKKQKSSIGTLIGANLLVAGVVGGVFTGLIFLFTWMFSGFDVFDGIGKIMFYIFLGCFALLTIFMFSANGIPKQSVEELDKSIENSQKLIEKLDCAINQK